MENGPKEDKFLGFLCYFHIFHVFRINANVPQLCFRWYLLKLSINLKRGLLVLG